MKVTFGRFSELSKADDTKQRTATSDMFIYKGGDVAGHIRKMVETVPAWGLSKNTRRVVRYELHIKTQLIRVWLQNPPTRWLPSVKAAAKKELTQAHSDNP